MISCKSSRQPRANRHRELTLSLAPTYNWASAMKRIFVGIFLTTALLLGSLSLRAQQAPASPDNNKPQQPGTPAGQQPASQDQQPVRQDQGRITTTVNLVDVLFTVLNRRNKLVPDLEKDD